jgi:glyceraldehyde-3-phosphate dehydrogenase (NADP+)
MVGAAPARDEVRNPYTNERVGTIAIASASDMNDAIEGAARGFAAFARWPRFKRKELLLGIAQLLRERRGDFVELMIAESGKPRTYAELEVDRAIATFTLGAEEATRTGGEVLPLDLSPATEGYTSIVTRRPIGVVGAIAPFNFPLNLIAHKLAPAFAVGNTVVLKPPPQAPLTALELARAIYDAGLPREALSVVHCPVEVAQSLATDDRIAMLSFTGSAAVGWRLKNIAGRKRVALELGGNAAAIVCADADIAWAAKRCALGSFAQAGQVCIKVQRVLVDATIWEPFCEAYVRETAALHVGDPTDPQTIVGPVIDESSAERIMSWIDEAVAQGARLLHGGKCSGTVIEPTILTDTRATMKVECEEVFGPVSTIAPFRTIDEAFDRANASRYGLQAGLFTYDIRTISRAFHELEVGAVIVNDAPTFRADNYPYGGTKDSGFGREGVRYAMQEMTDLHTLVLSC